MLWPIVLIFLKQIWSFIFPQNPKVDKQENIKKVGENIDGSTKDLPIGEVIIWNSGLDWNTQISKESTTIVKFTAQWCKPCKAIDPLYHELCKQYSSDKQVTEDSQPSVHFFSIDVDEFDEIAAENGAITIPLFVSYRNGKRVQRLSGKDEEAIRKFVSDSLTI